MAKKMFRYFGGLTLLQENWLNKMAANGYRLIRTGKLLYEFADCVPGAYQYKVEFIADKSKSDAQSYKAFLEGCGYTVFYKNANLNFSVGKVRYRPWAENGAKLATNSSTFNKELLIVEKENDGKDFVLHTTIADHINYCKKWRNIWLTYFAALALMGILFAFKTPVTAIVLGVIGIITLIPSIVYQAQVTKLVKQHDLEE